jgi:hypothetical protein
MFCPFDPFTKLSFASLKVRLSFFIRKLYSFCSPLTAQCFFIRKLNSLFSVKDSKGGAK